MFLAVQTRLRRRKFVGNVYAQINNIEKYDPFILGLNQLGLAYNSLPDNIYNILSNSLINPVRSDPNVGVYMSSKTQIDCGIYLKDEMWYFCIQKYSNDLMNILDELENKL